MRKLNRNTKIFLLAILSGIFLSLSWPERGYEPIIFFAFVPLLFAQYISTGRDQPRRNGIMFGNFFMAMLLWNAVTTWWIYNSTDIGSFVAIGLNAFLMAVVWQLFYLIRKKQGPAIGYLSLIFLWIAFEYLHLNWEISWPWLTLGNVFSTMPQWIQWYEFTGVLGGTLWILAVNILLFQLARNIWNRELIFRLRKINIGILFGLSFVLIIVPIVLSVYIYNHTIDKGKPLNVAVVQPNIDPYNEKFNGTGADQLASLLRLGATVIDTNTEYMFGPETALPDGIWEENIENDRSIKTIRTFLAGYPKLKIILGLTSFRQYEENNKTITARKYRDSKVYYDVFNAALQISAYHPVQLYHKSRLVPGVEKMPYPKIFGFLEKYAIDLGGTSGSLGTQDKRINFISNDRIKVAPAICYESIYGDFMRGYIIDTAAFIGVITNDGWWGDTPGYRQHMNYARLMAISFRKSIARSANTGVSCFINQRGDVLSKTNWWEEDAITGKVYANNKITFYARNGDYIGFISAFIVVSLLLYLLLKEVVGRVR